MLKKFAYIEGVRYEVKEIDGDWVELSGDGKHIAKLVDFEEARRVIWNYWANLGKNLEYLTEEDFNNIPE